ncbi:uncharacterized protein LOC131214476, partial [Anopheles bellator]|uniref:uncharacterized protein LOC131214476 n=1 Tax=Anopheles bellator TaxID=139047 RepID=UPI0026497869
MKKRLTIPLDRYHGQDGPRQRRNTLNRARYMVKKCLEADAERVDSVAGPSGISDVPASAVAVDVQDVPTTAADVPEIIEQTELEAESEDDDTDVSFDEVYDEDLSDEFDGEDVDPEIVEQTEPETTDERFRHALKEWFFLNNITLQALSKLLSVVRMVSPNLPKSAKAFLQSKAVTVPTTTIAGGEYWHRGVGNGLKRVYRNIDRPKDVSIYVNIDGLPLYRQSMLQAWPVLGTIVEEPKLRPFVIGVFCGKKKPQHIEEYLRPFVDEMRDLMATPCIVNGFIVNVRLQAFICDTPARAFLKGTVHSNGYHGCQKCTAVLQPVENSHELTYPLEKADLRTDQAFGPLPNISTYPFENLLYSIKRSVHSGFQPLQQICNKILDIEAFELSSPANPTA